ncbi:portal domain protein, partial [Salmonella enterica]|nr:portal domain protein [Salmonella enterica]
QEIFRQQVRESEERRAAGLSRPVWITDTYQQQIAASRQTEEEKRAT